MIKYVFSKEQKEEIVECIKNCKIKRLYKKLEVLHLKSKGKTLKEIAEITEYEEHYISRLINQYFTKGINDYTKNKYEGNNRKLTKEKEEEFLKPFIERANKGEMLTVTEIREAYNELIGKKSSYPTIYLLLRRNNWRKVMPRSKNPNKASDEAIEAYKKNL